MILFRIGLLESSDVASVKILKFEKNKQIFLNYSKNIIEVQQFDWWMNGTHDVSFRYIWAVTGEVMLNQIRIAKLVEFLVLCVFFIHYKI